MEVTKWLKPSISVSRIGDSANVQAATRVNASHPQPSRERLPFSFSSTTRLNHRWAAGILTVLERQ
jgi:hypothetical protein